jgi:hypothetical protein
MRLRPLALLNRTGAIQALALHPWVFIRPERMHDAGLIEHERVHLQEQEAAGALRWWWRYLTSREFRLHAELRAYRRQIAANGTTVERAAGMLARHYRLNIDVQEAARLLLAQP